MEPLVNNGVMGELTQILSNLVLGENEIRREAERLLNEKWLVNQPEAVLLALAQMTRQSPDDHMRSFAAVLTRRLLFRPIPPPSTGSSLPTPSTIYDHLSENTRRSIEEVLLLCLRSEPDESVRNKIVDTICDIAIGSMERGRPWPELQAAAFECSQSPAYPLRQSALKIFANVPQLILDQEVSVAVSILERGLQDPESVEVRHASLRASSAYLSVADAATQAQALRLMYPMLETLPPLSLPQLSSFIRTLIPLCTSQPSLFREHLQSLLAFLVPLASSTQSSKPALDGSTSNHMNAPVPSTSTYHRDDTPTQEDEEKDIARRAALEFLVSLTEGRPPMVVACAGWVPAVVKCCLEGMAEIRELHPTGPDSWLETDDPNEDDEEDYGYSHVYEESLDRCACALGGKALLPVAFQHIPIMLSSPNWMQRHAALLAIGAVAEGTYQIMEKELEKVISIVLPMFHDPHPRVRYAACQCIGQLCTDLEEIIQAKYHVQLFGVLIPTLRAPEPRVHAHAAAALINFCMGVESTTLTPYLDEIVSSLLAMLGPASKNYVQEQAITTLAMVADAAAANFQKYYSAIMPNLLTVLRTAGPELRSLRCKVMECAGLIAMAVGAEIFEPDSAELGRLLMQIQNNVTEPDDPTANYLVLTWSKLAQAIGPAFEPYMAFVMPPLLRSAALKADVAIMSEEDDPTGKEGWDVIEMNGQQIGIRTAYLEEKCAAFDTMLTYCATLGAKFAPYLPQALELALPCLNFFFHDGVREACAQLIPVLLVCGKESGTLTPAMLDATYQRLIRAISTETDSGFLASLFKCFTDSSRVLKLASISPTYITGITQAIQAQMHALAQKRKARAGRVHGKGWEEEKEELLLIEEMEGFALDEMVALLKFIEAGPGLLVAVGSIRELGISPAGGEVWGDDDRV